MAKNNLDLQDIIKAVSALTKNDEPEKKDDNLDFTSLMSTLTNTKEKEDNSFDLSDLLSSSNNKEENGLLSLLGNLGIGKNEEAKEEEKLVALLEEKGYTVDKKSGVDSAQLMAVLTAAVAYAKKNNLDDKLMDIIEDVIGSKKKTTKKKSTSTAKKKTTATKKKTSTAKKSTSTKKTTAKKSAAKKTTAKKTSTKKTSTKKSTTKKSTSSKKK